MITYMITSFPDIDNGFSSQAQCFGPDSNVLISLKSRFQMLVMLKLQFGQKNILNQKNYEYRISTRCSIQNNSKDEAFPNHLNTACFFLIAMLYNLPTK